MNYYVPERMNHETLTAPDHHPRHPEAGPVSPSAPCAELSDPPPQLFGANQTWEA